jgi:hypothetical protein
MLKKIIGSTLVLVSLAGCGHHQHWVAPAVVGVAVGHAIAQSNQPQVRTEQVIVVQPARVIVDYSVCNQWNYQERESCFRGVEARARQEQARRNQEAYRQGYGR